MKKQKTERRFDRLEENLQSLKLSTSKDFKVIYKEMINLREGLLDWSANSSAKKQTASLERSIENIENLEKRIGQLEDGIFEYWAKINRDYQRFKAEAFQTEEERRVFKILYELSTTIYSEEDINILLDTVIDSVIDLFSAERGFLEVVDEDKKVRLKISKDQEKKTIEEEEEKIKSQINEAISVTGNPILVTGLLISELEEEKEEPIFKSILCVPLKSKDKVLGSIYLDDTKPDTFFTSSEVKLLLTLSERIASAVENNLMLMELKESHEKLLEDLREKFKFDEIIGNSPQMVEILKTVADVADTDATVLIEGESGTGKELLARAIHFNSSRSKKPFVTINCAAIPETLLESELFGYEKGAFTGATQRKLGKFEVANGGTIFLDEIGEMSLLLQVKILRFLQSHEFEPLGSNKVKRSEIRIIAATNKELSTLIKEDKFREDLYYRINVINLKLPPLRERRLDIAPLALSFASKFEEKTGKKISGIEPEALNLLTRYSFPGNIRELENTIERAVILAKSDMISKEDLPKHILNGSGDEKDIEIPKNYEELKFLRRKAVEKVERNFLNALLEKNENNISQAALDAKMHRVELQRLLKKYR
jgi:Nif-specific regulatory protein